MIALGKKRVDMLSGSIFKGILSMMIPVMVMNVVQSIYSLIDMTVLSDYASDSAVGAVGTCGTLISLCTGLLIGVSTGANVIVARRIGEGDKLRTQKAGETSLVFALISGTVMAVIGIVFAELFLKWINCPESLLKDATLYFRLYFLGVPVLMVYNFSGSLLRATGDTKRPMYFLLIGGAVKVVSNYILLAVFHRTVDGVAIATIISWLLSGALAFTAILKNEDVFCLGFKKPKMYWSELKDILYIGIPAGLQTALYSFANTVIVKAVNTFGENATTGLSIANQFDAILYQISVATSYASTPYISQNIGAKKFDRVKKIILNSIFITCIFGITFGSLSAIFSKELSSIMSSTPEVIDYSCQKMIIISSTYFICGINEVMGGTLRGMGKPIVPMISTLIFMCLIRFPWVYFVFPLYPNLTFLYLVWPIGWILSIITLTAFYFPTMKRLKGNSL